ncbi:hypothetical protein NUW58_g5088 [Xylaria curta]|uniref:Uncharacterized protein n=1 Tax=Xylaria curta TaxID=42375 RepID=A0ACC1P4G6_9PEZI|nr:hypothetical protein NUW58_g5088 [Xylaria curta]
MDCSDWQHTTIIQPLFRALFMVLVYPDKLMIPTEPRDMSWVPNAKVQLILTGITEGLSAPISFDELREYSIGTSYTSGGQTITTTLSIATEFILHLEQREIAAFGIQPNTCSLPADALRPRLLEIREKAKKLGWVEERDGSLDDLSPRSSEWVDRTIFPTWLGDGAIETLRTTQYRIHDFTKTQYTEDWWWNPQDLPDSATRDVKVCKRITEW